MPDTDQFPELYADFTISSSSSLDLDEITRTLGVEPTRKSVRGSRISSPPHPRFNIWELATNRQRSVDAEPMIATLVQTLEGCGDALGHVRKRYPEAEFGITVVAYLVAPDGVTPGIGMSAELLSRIAALRLSFSVSLYLVDAQTDQSS